jgi:NADH:ubiquinone oxidoreductase subunit F (NADH-binding)
MTTATLHRTERLLRTGPDGPTDPGLATHLDLHGPLVVPTRDDRDWSHAVWREVAASGLTGRGGGGFPAAAKWDAVTRSGRRPLVVVNAMEGEPASAKDRVLLTWSPHLVLDGAEVAAALSGAREIVVCVADDRDPTARAVDRALAERARAGGGRPASVVRPPARYLTGEESALVSWLERREARPVFRVDKSVPLLVGRCPVLVHNAETLAQVALVVRHGAAWFRELGTPEAPGSTLVTVSGAVRSPGVLEVALGTPVDELIGRVGPTGPVAGLLVGGYGGAWLHPGKASVPYAPGPLAAAEATHGVGILVVLPASSCGITETARIARFMAGESAGQCGPCVFGLPAIADDLDLLAAGRGDAAVVARIERRCSAVDGRGACRHPDGVVRLVRSALAVFADDVSDHAAGRPCAGHGAPTVLQFPVVAPVPGGVG